MRADVQARGFSLTPALRAAVEHGVRDYEARFPRLSGRLLVRLFDVNGRRGGIDKGCLAQAQVGKGRAVVVASDLDADLYRAIAATFDKLERSTAAALARQRAGRHAPSWGET
jgi:ribosome-associated translation inhibitor RaiA